MHRTLTKKWLWTVAILIAFTIGAWGTRTVYAQCYYALDPKCPGVGTFTFGGGYCAICTTQISFSAGGTGNTAFFLTHTACGEGLWGYYSVNDQGVGVCDIQGTTQCGVLAFVPCGNP